MALLDVRDLRIDIPLGDDTLHAVRGLDLQVERGEMLCLVGESGCGKSLTSLALMDLLPHRARRQAARLSLGEHDLLAVGEKGMRDLRGNRLAMIFQEPMTALNPAYSIGDQLAEVLRRHRKLDRKTAWARAEAMLEKVGISNATERLRQYPHQLSGGLRQRVVIAMALLCEPDLIIADEPTTALDVTIQAQILHLLRDLQREFGTAIVFITHDLGLVARIADRVAVMYAGQIVEQAPAAELFAEPRHPYTRGLLASIPVPGRTRPGQPLGAIPGLVPSLVGEQHGCAFRNRCPQAVAACADSVPLVEEEAHLVRCHFAVRSEPLRLVGGVR
ncbi:ABC transporter ATP-binding protein [Pseudomonas sp. EpS/L25]|uniref:ABC transporter ATP-binding protein n=1 Tax=Pseudomonas sp. EpS/L25 TaxID=1749078 RepID=UPI0007438196|nr:ABC transporter ATP-binding protein [Pseudomonas sp. EpS/L25]KUM44732.1 peptide ABC transporter substrate-binding protein [Pseudomonas sp. EpS/L25]